MEGLTVVFCRMGDGPPRGSPSARESGGPPESVRFGSADGSRVPSGAIDLYVENDWRELAVLVRYTYCNLHYST